MTGRGESEGNDEEERRVRRVVREGEALLSTR